MPKKKTASKKSVKKTAAAERIVLRTGEALVEAEPAYSAAEPEAVIGELDGPVGYAIANLIGDQSRGHSKVFAILNCDVQVRPVTVGWHWQCFDNQCSSIPLAAQSGGQWHPTGMPDSALSRQETGISRNALASGLCSGNRGLAPCG